MSNYRFDSKDHKTPKPKRDDSFRFYEDNAFTRAYERLIEIAVKVFFGMVVMAALYIVAVIIFS